MEDIKQSIFKSIETIVDARVEELKFSKTIEAEVYSDADASKGKYLVKYQDSIFSAYSNDVTIVYKKGDNVLILIPDGDFSAQKNIIGKKNGAANEGFVSVLDSLQKIDLIGPDWSTLLGYDKANPCAQGLIAGSNIEKVTIFSGFDDLQAINAKLFMSYFNKCEVFLMKANFKTNFPKNNIDAYYGGNYGVKIIYKKENKLYSYILDISRMTGDPYSYSSESPQYVIYKYDKKALENAEIKSIEFFQEGFNVTPQEKADIFITQLELSFAEEINFLEAGYSVNVMMPKGDIVNIEGIPLIPQLKLNGTPTTYSKAFWFIQDLSIGLDSDDYSQYGGLGWRALKENIDKDTLTIKSGVYTETKFKIVLIKDKLTFARKVSVFPQENLYNFFISVAHNKETVSLKVEPSGDYKYAWGRDDAEGNRYLLPELTSTLDFNINEIYLNNIFFCSIYNNNKELLSTVFKVITKEFEKDAVNIVFTGNHTYNYDANGDIDFDSYSKSHELGYNLITSDEMVLDIASQEWTLPPLEESLISPIPEQNLTNEKIYYNIKPKYSSNKTNNTIKLTIKTRDEQTFTFFKEIACIKTGNSGTNGTKYIANLEITGYVDKGNLNKSATALLKLYKDGEMIVPENVNWYLAGKGNRLISNPKGTSNTTCYVTYENAKNLTKEEEFLATVNILKATIKVEKTEIHVFSMIPVVLAGTYSGVNLWNKWVEYSASGENPLYNKDFKIDETYTTTANSLLTLKDKQYIPIAKYENDGKCGNIIFKKGSNSILWSVTFYLNAFGNKAINGWDGVSLSLDEASGYILSPVVGAGSKNATTNKFDGVLMGTIGRFTGTSMAKDTGLFGFRSGIQTFSLNAKNGNVALGAAGEGQILIEANKSTIESGNYIQNTSGMKIDLKQGTIDSKHFKVNSSGSITATNANLSGTITAIDGSLGGWTINSWGIQSRTGDCVLGADGVIDASIINLIRINLGSSSIGTEGTKTQTGTSSSGRPIYSYSTIATIDTPDGLYVYGGLRSVRRGTAVSAARALTTDYADSSGYDVYVKNGMWVNEYGGQFLRVGSQSYPNSSVKIWGNLELNGDTLTDWRNLIQYL